MAAKSRNFKSTALDKYPTDHQARYVPPERAMAGCVRTENNGRGKNVVVLGSGSIAGEGEAFIDGASSSARAIEGGVAGSSTATAHWTDAAPPERGSRAQTPAVRTGLRSFLRSGALRWGVTLALLAYAISQLSADQIAEIAGWNSVALLLVSSVVVLAVVGLNTVRWLLVARICRVQMPWRRSFQWTMIGHFFNQIFPSSVGGDVVRGALAGRGIDDMGGAFSSIALERIVGFVALLALIAVGQPLLIARLHDQSLSYLALAAVLLGLCALAAAFVLSRFVGNRAPGACRPRRTGLPAMRGG